MIWAAVSGETARMTMPAVTRFIHASRGILPSVMPGQRMVIMVVMKFTAVPMLPMPEINRAKVQKSVLCPTEKARDVNGA
jgi:hypothetical protein